MKKGPAKHLADTLPGLGRGDVYKRQGLQSAMGEDRTLGICMQPTFSDKSRQPCYVQPSQLTGLGSSGTDAEKKAAAAALNYIINDVDANKVLLNERGVSMNSEVCEAIANDLDAVSYTHLR